MTFDEFKTKWENEILPNKPDFIRSGQSLVNYLSEVWVEGYKRLVYQDRIDCFYVDELIPTALEYLESIWDTYPN